MGTVGEGVKWIQLAKDRLDKRRECTDQLSNEASRKILRRRVYGITQFGIKNVNGRRYIQHITSTILGSSTVIHYTCLTTAVLSFKY
jgi:hypothetical protein